MTPGAIVLVRESIATHSKSFALASRLLPTTTRDDTAAVYAFCRRADDAVDRTSERVDAKGVADVVAHLRTELASVYAGAAQPDPVLAAFQDVVQRHGIPERYPAELLEGMAMDAAGTEYDTVDDLLVYCFRVAGTVGLMMSHVLGVRDASALKHAAHLGMAMQLTNICRDVREDWDLRRLYLPASLLSKHGASGLRAALGGPLARAAAVPIARTARELLDHADALYASADAGVPLLPFRAAIAVRTARLVYADIGRVIDRQGADPFAPRAVVSTARKLRLALVAVIRTALDTPRDDRRAELSTVLGFHDVVPS